MSATKTPTRWGVLLRDETTYGAGGTGVPATDGLRVYEDPAVSVSYMDDGRRVGRAPATPGINRSAAKSGRYGEVTLATEMHGPGIAYTASVVPNFHRLARIAGLTGTVGTTPGSERWDYVPANDGAALTSAALEVYRRGQLYALTGVYAAGFTLTAEAGKIVTLSAPCMGIMPSEPTDIALPAITYPSVLPPKALAMAITIDGYTPVRVKSAVLEFTRGLTPRLMDVSTGVHGGFTPDVTREAKLALTLEAAALATWNPFTRRSLNGSFAFTMTIGATAYNRIVLAAAQAEVEDVSEAEDGGTATWEVSLGLKVSGPTASDEFTLSAT